MAPLPDFAGCIASAFIVQEQRFIFMPFGKFGSAYVGTNNQLAPFVRAMLNWCISASVFILVFATAAVWVKVGHDPRRWLALGGSLALLLAWTAMFVLWSKIAPKRAYLCRIDRHAF
ncbi:MAG: hypothetical protein KGM17_15880 [Sphingomonadales bacterium]|nr:hypothetical protein [Sphingomonadales bacterium]